jgi:RNA methyltransferase, TrmH family
MSVSQLTSKDNALLKTIRLIASGSKNAPEDMVVAEGIRVLEEANASGCSIDAVVFSKNFGSDARGQDLLDEWNSRGIRLFQIPENLFKSISSVQTPQGALALVRVPRQSFAELSFPAESLILCAFGIQDPGNLGTLIRTAFAAGVTLVCTTQGTVSARNPKSIRSSAGAFFHLPIIEHIGFPELRSHCNSHSIRLYRTATRDGIIHTEADLRSSCAIVLGNEGSGIGTEEFEGLLPIRIPMAKGAESLNVAIAGAIILFEASRQRSEV